MSKICISYFLHFPIGCADGEYFIKNVLNKYFSEVSDECQVSIISSVMPRQSWHSDKLMQNLRFINKNQNGKLLISLFCLIKEIRRADVIFLFMHSKNSVLCGLIAKIVGKKFVTYFGNDWEHLELHSSNPNKVRAFLKRKASLFLSMNSVCSFYTGKGLLVRHHGQNKYLTSPIVNIEYSNFIERDRYPYLRDKKLIKLLYVGALIERKGLTFLLDALAMIKKGKIHIDLIGDGADRDKLIDKARYISDNISFKFHGYLHNNSTLYNFYREADAFILPSFSEGLPRVLYEAVSQGCPIITTPVNSVPYLFEHNYDSLFITPGDSINIKETIIKIIETPGLNQQLATNALKTVLPFFKEKPGKQHVRIVKTCLNL